MKKTFMISMTALITLALTGAVFAGNNADSFTAMSVGENIGTQAPMSAVIPMKIDVPTKAVSVTFYNDQAVFSAAAPGLTLEDFENGAAGPGAIVGCPSTLSAASPGACYPAGELEEGFSFSATTGMTVALGAGVVPVNPSTWVAADLFAAGTYFDFSGSDVYAVGFELFSFFNAPITVTIFNADGDLLGTAIHPAGATFFGVKTDEAIANVSMNAGPVSVFDNLQFGKGVIDTDGDGVSDDEDACLTSDLSATVAIDGCDSGVGNTLGADGCTISDLVGMCATGVNNHGQYVSCVAQLTRDLKKAGEISGADKGAINSCAAQSNLP